MGVNRGAGEFRVRERDKEQAFQYFDRRSKSYHKGGSFLRRLPDPERATVLQLAELDQGSKKTMIDVGCGGGFYAMAAQKLGLHVSAVDFSPGVVEHLKGLVDESWVADIETLHVQATYNIVICSGVLDFVLDPERAFANLARLVSRGGRLVVQVPRAGPWGWLYRVEKRLAGMSVNLYSLSWFSEQAQTCGLHVIAHRFPLPHNMVVAFDRPSTNN